MFVGVIDMNEVDEAEVEEAICRDLLPSNFVDELSDARNYDELVDSEVNAVAFDEGDDSLLTPALAVPASANPAPHPLSGKTSSNHITVCREADPSKLVPHRQQQLLQISDFETALGLYAHIVGTNRSEYAAIREVFSLLPCVRPYIESLPNQLSTLKDRISNRFPLFDMRVADIPLKVDKLATEKASRKLEEAQAGKEITARLHIIDPTSVFTAFMSSDIGQDMHMGLAHFVDEPVELYHSHSWASSIRTTSGEFAHIIGWEETEEGDVIDSIIDVVFPSDIVLYACTITDCPCQEADSKRLNLAHIGRVYGIGKDYRTDFCTEEQGQIALQIQEVFGPTSNRREDMRPHHPFVIANLPDPPKDECDMVLDTRIVYVPQTHLVKVVTDDFLCDYYWGETFEDPSPAIQKKKGKKKKGKAKEPKPFPKYSHAPVVPQTPCYIRRAILQDGKSVVPLCHTHPIRAQLELEVYGRECFERWDKLKTHSPDSVLSCPILVFIDGFGLYRNSYRSLIGVYVIPAGLDGDNRHRPANIFPISLSPHGSNFDDTVRALQSLANLDIGVTVMINGKESILCVPTLCYLGDMPQQDKNSGFRGPKALKPCRFCHYGQSTIKSGVASDILDFDVITHGRYHHQAEQMRKQMESLKTATDKRTYGSQWGISEEKPALIDISPALDLILSRPPDPAHSEYQGMTALLHSLLLDGILTATAQKSYGRVLRLWPFPPGWERLQSPIHHLRSYSLAAHARWSIIAPALLRSWLEPEHIHPLFMQEAMKQLGTAAGEEEQVVNFIVKAFASLAKSNSVLMGLKISANDRASIDDIIRQTRIQFQRLCAFTSQSIADNPRAYNRFGPCQPPVIRTVPQGQESIPLETGDVAMSSIEEPSQQGPPKRATQYIHDMTRPNVHVGVHYPMIADEYSLPANINTLLGENQHR
jgi:hypothetical protein